MKTIFLIFLGVLLSVVTYAEGVLTFTVSRDIKIEANQEANLLLGYFQNPVGEKYKSCFMNIGKKPYPRKLVKDSVFTIDTSNIESLKYSINPESREAFELSFMSLTEGAQPLPQEIQTLSQYEAYVLANIPKRRGSISQYPWPIWPAGAIPAFRFPLISKASQTGYQVICRPEAGYERKISFDDVVSMISSGSFFKYSSEEALAL